MNELGLPDKHHLEAAQGWLELGNLLEANEELENISPQLRSHPDVLNLRWQIYAKAEKWEMAAEIGRALTEMLPGNSFGWIHLAYSLHAMKRTREAREVLLPVVDKFSEDYIFRYNLACYACQLGDLTESKKWLEKAFELADKSDVKKMALDDPDLEPLWAEIGEI